MHTFRQRLKRVRLVDNYKKGWRWCSTWAFMLIAFIASTPIDPAIIAVLPHKDKVLAIIAVCGLVLRFVSQQPKKDDANKDDAGA